MWAAATSFAREQKSWDTRNKSNINFVKSIDPKKSKIDLKKSNIDLKKPMYDPKSPSNDQVVVKVYLLLRTE